MSWLISRSNSFNLFKQLNDTSLGDTLANVTRIIVWHLSFIALHGKRLSWTSLSIGKNSPVIPIDYSINQVPHSHTLVNIILIIIRCKYLVKSILLSPIEASGHHHLLILCLLISNFNMLLIPNGNLIHSMTLHLLMLEHWSDSNAYFDLSVRFAATPSILLLSSSRRWIVITHFCRRWRLLCEV